MSTALPEHSPVYLTADTMLSEGTTVGEVVVHLLATTAFQTWVAVALDTGECIAWENSVTDNHS